MTQKEKKKLLELQTAVDRQSEDEGLWFDTVTASEAYLQSSLRALHTVIEEAVEELCGEKA